LKLNFNLTQREKTYRETIWQVLFSLQLQLMFLSGSVGRTRGRYSPQESALKFQPLAPIFLVIRFKASTRLHTSTNNSCKVTFWNKKQFKILIPAYRTPNYRLANLFFILLFFLSFFLSFFMVLQPKLAILAW
jgi:hypothetical protein